MSQPPLQAERRVYTVAELLGGVRRLLEDRVGRVWVAGEISNLFRAASGHLYFTLKDDSAQVRAALFRSASRRLPFEIEEGLEVLAYGDVGVYEARGDLQIVVRALEPRGVGALQLALEQLRRRLEAEGLFDAARKRRLPEWPRTLGVVTSPAGAALRDVIHVSGQRMPGVPLLVSPTRVQGVGAEEEIAAALDRLSERDEVDVVLLVRGGGSLEDLQAFNSEAVARAIVRSRAPVVSGVGHETDISIADWAADARAPTPSAAAALALPDRRDAAGRLADRWQRLRRAMAGQLETARTRLAREGDALRVLAPSARLATWRARLRAASHSLHRQVGREAERRRQRVLELQSRLLASPPDLGRRRLRLQGTWRALVGEIHRQGERRRARLAAAAGHLDGLSPLGVLSRGFALVRREDDGRIVRGPEDVRPGERVEARVARAELVAQLLEVRARDDSKNH